MSFFSVSVCTLRNAIVNILGYVLTHLWNCILPGPDVVFLFQAQPLTSPSTAVMPQVDSCVDSCDRREQLTSSSHHNEHSESGSQQRLVKTGATKSKRVFNSNNQPNIIQVEGGCDDLFEATVQVFVPSLPDASGDAISNLAVIKNKEESVNAVDNNEMSLFQKEDEFFLQSRNEETHLSTDKKSLQGALAPQNSFGAHEHQVLLHDSDDCSGVEHPLSQVKKVSSIGYDLYLQNGESLTSIGDLQNDLQDNKSLEKEANDEDQEQYQPHEQPDHAEQFETDQNSIKEAVSPHRIKIGKPSTLMKQPESLEQQQHQVQLTTMLDASLETPLFRLRKHLQDHINSEDTNLFLKILQAEQDDQGRVRRSTLRNAIKKLGSLSLRIKDVLLLVEQADPEKTMHISVSNIIPFDLPR